VKSRAFIALGSNLNDPLRRIDAAFRALAELPATQLSKRSPRYRNRAVGPGRQPDFVNAVAELITGLDPYGLLDALQDIERSHGRERNAERWAPRVIDLDILLYGDRRVRDDRLTLPHPEMHLRRFVLQPLSDIAPDLEVPGHGPLRDLLKRAPAHALTKIVAGEAALEFP
jgi:2-amino-4-hydroxy-6-hydroxymethyldihydropteridine diphosphokinase